MSICIPAYNEVDFLKTAINSCLIQTYTDFEIVVTDDTPDNSIEKIIRTLASTDNRIKYFRNPGPRGAAVNSNYAVKKSRGEWIKFLYHDDLFAYEYSLREFVDNIDNGDIIFSPCFIIDGEETRTYHIASDKLEQLTADPIETLIKFSNVVGAPSAIMFKKENFILFHEDFVWLLDVFLYIQMAIKGLTFHCLSKPVIVTTMHPNRLTEKVCHCPRINLFENLKILKTISTIDKYTPLAHKFGNYYSSTLGGKMSFSDFYTTVKSADFVNLSFFLSCLLGKCKNMIHN